ncbi:glycosyltransferase family 8 protein [Phocaeicola dorei]|uniref:glycosyltransferase family 8 protein n=1 Tax=Phocaeicola dorei TaxID=357276 RepID=UPI00321BBFCA
MEKEIKMNICIAADEKYVTHLQVVMLSVMENNKQIEEIVFHIFEYGISSDMKIKIQSITGSYGRDVVFYNINNCIDCLKRKIRNVWAENNSYVAYARIYMSDILPETVKKFLYLDCDTLIIGSLKEIFQVDLGRNVLAGIKDVLPYAYKQCMGFADGDYYNSGVLLFNAVAWRKENLTDLFFDYCNNHQEDVFPDQDAINILLKDRITTLHPQYCVFYPENGWDSRRQIKGYGGDETSYYSLKDLDEAKKNPVIIHYVDTIIGRPWQSNNINPYAKQWLKYYAILPKSFRVEFAPKKMSISGIIYRWMFRILPESIFCKIYYLKRNKAVKLKMEEAHKC